MLLWLIYLPLIGGLIGCIFQLYAPYLSLKISNQSVLQKLPAWIAILSVSITLLLAISCWHDAITTIASNQVWFKEIDWEWIPLLGIRFHLIMDSFSVLMISTSLIIVLLTLVYSYNKHIQNASLFYFCLLTLTSSVTLFFVVSDLFFLFLCWELIAIPFYFLISLWGRQDSNIQLRFSGVSKFLIYTQISSLLMLISIVSLALINWTLTNNWSFDSQVLTKTPISSEIEFFLMLGFLLAFIVRIPLVPFHNWFIEAHNEASTTGAIITSCLVINTGIYGLLRFVLPIFPNASQAIMPAMLIISFITLLYAALVAFNQSDIKKFIAYIHISIMGSLVAMVYSSSLLTHQGLSIQIIAVTFSMAGMFIISGLLTRYFSTRNIHQFVGLRVQKSLLSSLALFFMLAVIGVPGTANFIGNYMMLMGIYSISPYYSIFLILGLILISISLVVRMQPIYYGVAHQTSINDKTLPRKDLILLLILATSLFILGLYPQIILDMSHPFIKQISQHLNIVHVGGQ